MNDYENATLQTMHSQLDAWFEQARHHVSDDLPENRIEFGLTYGGYDDETDEQIIGGWFKIELVESL